MPVYLERTQRFPNVYQRMRAYEHTLTYVDAKRPSVTL